MRIAHLLLTRRFAGSERYAVELANAQAEHHEVTVLLRHCAFEPRADAIAHRLSPKVQRVDVGEWFARWRVRHWLRQQRPDVAHAHLSGGCRALRGLRVPGMRRVATLHIHYKPQQHADLDGLIAIAPWQLPAIPEALRARSVQIDNWTQAPGFDAEARARLRAELGLADDTVLVGALGRAEPGKGMDVLLDAWRRLAAQPKHAQLALVGAGSAWNALRAAAPAEVLMPGFVERPSDWLSAFDVFVSPARNEPFGLVLLEAMRSGLPILASQSEGARHLASVIARPLLPIGDATALAAALRALIDAPPRRCDYALARFGAAARMAEIEAWYRQLP